MESKNVNHATATNQTITGNESITPQTNMYHKGTATPLGCLWTSVDMAKKATANGGCGRHRPHRGLKVNSTLIVWKHENCAKTEKVTRRSRDYAATTCWQSLDHCIEPRFGRRIEKNSYRNSVNYRDNDT